MSPHSQPAARYADVGRSAVPSPFLCRIDVADAAPMRVEAVGELDVATAPVLERVLARAFEHARSVVLVARELTFIDTAGVHIIVDASEGARRRGDELRVSPSSPVTDILALTGMSNGVDLVELEARPAGL